MFLINLRFTKVILSALYNDERKAIAQPLADTNLYFVKYS